MNDLEQSKDVRLIQGAVRLWRRRRGPTLLAAGIVALVWVISTGVYTVPTNETGALFLFGELIDDNVGPGIHVKLPNPIQRVALTNTTEVRRITLATEQQQAVSLVSGDENIIEVDLAVQYKITAYGAYLTAGENWESLLRETAVAALTGLIAEMEVDDILTTGKSRIQNELLKRTQPLLDRYGAGLTIVAVNIVSVQPPPEAAASFRRVADALSEKRKRVTDARSEQGQLLAQSRGESETIRSQAESVKLERVKKAEGDRARYLEVLAGYRAGREATRIGMYTESIRKVLGRARVLLYDPDAAGSIDLGLFTEEKPQP